MRERTAAVVVNYNDSETTLAQIRRIRDYAALDRIIVVDNASTGRTAHIARARAAGDVVVQSLTAAPSSTINVISATADLPLRIVSGLDQAATVRVHLAPSSKRLQIDHDVTVTVPAQGQATVLVPIKAVGSGDVDLSIELLAADGTVVGTPMTMRTRVRASWETVGTRVAAGLLVALLAGGITRTVRRGRRQDRKATA